MGFAERISDPRLQALYSYWAGKRRGRALPGRADVDPGELRALLPHILLIDVVEGGRDFRYRLVGTEIERHIERSITGRLISEVVSGDYHAYIRSLHQRVIAAGAPVYAENNFDGRRAGFGLVADFKRTHRLLLPLATDGAAIDMMLCGQTFHARSAGSETEILLIDQP